MPQIGFICPNGTRVSHEDCFKKCVMGRRCLTLPTLMEMGRSRTWKGRVSVTDCLKGTMEAFLRYTVNYHVNPQHMAWMLLGTRHHSLLEKSAKERIVGALSEEKIVDDLGISGISDLVDKDEENPNAYVLTDYKVWGSYMMAKALGIVKIERPDPAGGVFKSGPRKGMDRTIAVFAEDPTRVDLFDAEMQLNYYRIQLEKTGYPISRMQIQATARDGKTQSARSRGVTAAMYLFDIKRLNDKMVLDFFENKRNLLLSAMSSGICNSPCYERERWEDMKCIRGLTDGFCPVCMSCPLGRKLAQGTEIRDMSEEL